MGTLFAKIFIWYLVSVLVIVGAVLVTVLMIRNDYDASRFRSLAPSALLDFPPRLIGAVEEQHAQAIERIKTGAASRGTHLYLFDEQGNELLGKSTPVPVRQLFEKTRLSHDIEILSLPFSAYIAKYCLSKSGKGYVFVYTLTQVRPFAALGKMRGAWALSAVLLLAIVILCWWLTRQLTTPILAVGSGLSRLAAGDLQARIESRRFLSGADELVTLARNFNFMAERMGGLVLAQRRWIAEAAHELGSPLTRLSLALGIAQRNTPRSVLPYLNRMEEETDRLHSIMQQLLTLAQMDALPQPAATELIDLPDLICEIVNDCDFEAQAHGGRVKLGSSEPCGILGARELLRSAIENVVRNAVRYGAPSTEISVSLRLDHGRERAVIVVRDHGPGVPEEALKQMFEPFYRLRDRSGIHMEGAGLGLAITSRAAAAHGGSVFAENATGGGLEVTIELPAVSQD